MRRQIAVTIALAGLLTAAPVYAQGFGSLLDKGTKIASDLKISDEDEQQIGKDVSARLRDRYGVVQDKAIHTYVTLVGSVLAQQSSKPNLPWQFIVLDTDGINAFAAPGGYVHITRGALSILKNEAELADVLGHEITHVTARHTINAIKGSKVAGDFTAMAHSDMVKKFGDQATDDILNGKYSQSNEKDADKGGIALAAAAGWAPTGLSAFLTRLDDRNKNQPDQNGLFASHPDTKARLDALQKQITSQKLTATALVTARYTKNVTYPPVPPPAAGEAAPANKTGISGLLGGQDKGSNQTVSSGGSRGVNSERDAKGGPNKGVVTVSVTAADVADFKKGIA